MFRAHLKIVHDAAQVVLRRLDGLQRSHEQEQLQVWTEECVREAERWGAASASTPTSRDLDALMKRLLAVHVAVATLERGASQAGCNATAT